MWTSGTKSVVNTSVHSCSTGCQPQNTQTPCQAAKSMGSSLRPRYRANFFYVKQLWQASANLPIEVGLHLSMRPPRHNVRWKLLIAFMNVLFKYLDWTGMCLRCSAVAAQVFFAYARMTGYWPIPWWRAISLGSASWLYVIADFHSPLPLGNRKMAKAGWVQIYRD